MCPTRDLGWWKTIKRLAADLRAAGSEGRPAREGRVRGEAAAGVPPHVPLHRGGGVHLGRGPADREGEQEKAAETIHNKRPGAERSKNFETLTNKSEFLTFAGKLQPRGPD